MIGEAFNELRWYRTKENTVFAFCFSASLFSTALNVGFPQALGTSAVCLGGIVYMWINQLRMIRFKRIIHPHVISQEGGTVIADLYDPDKPLWRNAGTVIYSILLVLNIAVLWIRQ